MTAKPIRPAEVLAVIAVAALLLLPGLWSFTLIDPWEGHYAEVGRRILADNDWIRLSWRDEVFRSKPALAPWLIAASLRAHGIVSDGGFSGEMLASPELTVWAVRLPFALSAIGGMVALWLMLARLVSRRAAWIGLVVLGTTPFYFFVARQAITDMPMVAATTGALACFVLALHDGDRPLCCFWRRLNAWHLLLALLLLVVGGQVLYGASYFHAGRRLGAGVELTRPEYWFTLPFLLGLVAVGVLTFVVWPVRRYRDVYLLCAYALLGVSVLGKGPPGGALVVGVSGIYLLVTGQLRSILRLRLIEGTLVFLLVAAPWHVAMALRDGAPWLAEYIGHHWLKRAGAGVHMVNRPGEGSFTYFIEQLGYGLWPYLTVLPAAVLAGLRSPCNSTRDHVRCIATLWVIVGIALFTLVETKYHHYVLPAVPGFAVLIALWLDDVLARRIDASVPLLSVGAAVGALVTYDIYSQQERLIELFIYRYDRQWPTGEPWNVDLSTPLLVFGAVFVVAGLLVAVRRLARWAAVGLLVAGIVFAYYAMNSYMQAAAPHWGQGQLHATYYRQRRIHGATLRYDSLRDLARDWPEHTREFSWRTLTPENLATGDAMLLGIDTGGEHHELRATVSRFTAERVWVQLPEAETAALASLVERGQHEPQSRGGPDIVVDADRLIAWDLFWRSEIFWSGGELWGATADTRTVFRNGEDAKFLAYLARDESAGRRFFIITAAGHESRLRSLLPTARARKTLKVEDRSSNKFSLLSFSL